MYFKYEKDVDNIVTLTMDQSGSSTNLMGQAFSDAFSQVVERLVGEEELSGVIITSAKDTFMAGGDLESIYQLEDPAVAFEMVETIKASLRKLETIGKPVVAAINGAALGGGYEVALACHWRVALDKSKSQIGLPEVSLGLLPGGGGVTRLTRVLGLQNALPMLMEGKNLRPADALKAGLIDEIASDDEDMMTKARTWIAENPESCQPWDRKGFRIPGGDPNKPAIAQMVAAAPAVLTKTTRGNYPAPQAILNTAVEGALVDFDTASRIESRYFADLATGQVAKNMISAFWFQLNSINGGGSRPKDFPSRKVTKVGILGAGMMGAGIAYAAANSGVEVVLKDVSMEMAEKGKSYSDKILSKLVSRGKLSEEKKETVLSRILPTVSASDLKGCDLVIEAVFESRELKAQVTHEAEEQIDTDAIYASNTSTLPITGLAEAFSRQENFIGLHFFSPVDKMPLVEIIVGEKTSDETLARSFDFVKQIKKTPIVVSDSRGFYTSRVFSTYVHEGQALLAEGQSPRGIESAGLKTGMPVGPLALSDEVSLSLMLHVRQQTVKDLTAEGKPVPQHPAHAVVEMMVEDKQRLGKAAGKGFYEYPDEGRKFLWPELKSLFPQAAEPLDQTEMMERLMFVQALDTVRCLDEGVLRTVADANIGSIFGWGFAPFKGGSLQYINDYGLNEFVVKANELASRFGDRFIPPASLVEMAQKGEIYR